MCKNEKYCRDTHICFNFFRSDILMEAVLDFDGMEHFSK